MQKLKIKNLLLILPILISLFLATNVFAQESYSPENIKARLDELNQKIEEDVQNLKNQVSYIDAQIEKTELQITTTEQEIDLINLDVLRIEEDMAGSLI